MAERSEKKNKTKPIKKIYRTNKDAVAFNNDQIVDNDPSWPFEEKVDPRSLRKKGSRVCK
jgi:hypothetical protein